MNRYDENPYRKGTWTELLVSSGNKKASISKNALGVKISDNCIIFPKGYRPIEVHVAVDATSKCEAFEWPDRVTYKDGLATIILPDLKNYNTLLYHVLG